MAINVRAFGIEKEIFEKSSVEIEWTEADNVGNLKALLEKKYPALKKLSSYMIAVNNEYGEDSTMINLKDEVAVIPPVSGG
jgi:molybdopterin converting factor subunit 1